MRLIGLLVTLAILGYSIHVYLGSSSTVSVDGVQTKPVEYIDQAKQSTDALNDAMQKNQDKLENIR